MTAAGEDQSAAASRCPQCDGERVDVDVLGGQSALVARPPGGRWHGRAWAPLTGLTCIRCGLTQLYAQDPQRLA